ncbi:GRAS family protein [Runella slithyformis]|nr:GRAS family protein [Runella slithyformis]
MTLVCTNTLTELSNLAYQMPYQMTEANKESLNAIHEESVEDLDDPTSLFAYTLTKAMRKHFGQDAAQEHIYLQRFEIPQIRLFELLIQQFPLANLSQHCTNTLLIDALSQHTHPVLMDIGIGTGFQVMNIIEGLTKRTDCQIQQLTIVGIEPFADAVDTARQNINRVAQNADFGVSLVTRVAFIEALSLDELRQMLPNQYDGLYVNASFALHHIQQHSQRKMVFENLKALQINVLALSEPNSDHYEPIYARRFQNCVNHYGALFRIIDTLAISDTEKAALKLFFSREIDDVLGHSEEVRVEKHYAIEQWRELLTETGFVLQKRLATFEYTQLNGTHLQTDLSDRYATVFENEEITGLFWAVL